MTAKDLQVRTFVSTAGPNKGATRGNEPKNTLNSPGINIKTISNMKNLVAAYELIKSKPGNMTQGVDEITLDGLTLKYLEGIQAELKSGQYKFSPARRTHIPKPGKNETRPLTIASPREKIVQKAIQLVLEQLYEGKFLSTSHGFRPGKGSHTAMLSLEAQFQSVHYIIEADFTMALPSVNHATLMKILGEEIKCQKTLKLIKDGLKAGYFEFGELHKNLSIGTPQGSILSPLLCNIYLDKLDRFIESIKEEFNTGEKRPKNIEYLRLQNKAKY